MPTENRSSNTEMVSVPTLLAADNDRDMLEYLAEAVETQTYGCDQCGLEEPLSTFDIASNLRDYMLAFPQAPAQQPHPDPIAWMVGTAFWWTKEEAERDAVATGLPIVGLGPMVDQHQGEPVALPARMDSTSADWSEDRRAAGWNACLDEIAKLGPLYTHPAPAVDKEQPACAKLKVHELQSGRLVVEVAAFDAGQLSERGIVSVYTHADPGELERLRGVVNEWETKWQQEAAQVGLLRAQLAKAHGLLRLARQFVVNGVDLGYIQMPDADTPDPAHDLVPKIDAALSASAEPSAPECGHAACKSLGEPHPFCQFVKGLEQAEPSAPVELVCNCATRIEANHALSCPRAALERKP